jgi:acetyl coenzyme A synthetase (ADP forming)-like protein
VDRPDCGRTRDAATIVITTDPDRVTVSETGSVAQPSTSAPAYPHNRATDVVLRDGSTVHVRPVRHEDHDAIRAFLGAVSRDSIWFRFFGAANLDWAADWSVDVDYVDRYALIAETGRPARVIAHAAYLRIDRRRAEVAFLVADEDQGHGLSTIMLAHLAEAAGAESITTFVADVLPANHRMIETFRQSGFPVELRSKPGVIKIEFPTSMSAEAVARFAERDRVAAVAAVRRVLEPCSIAVIGGSRRRGTVGGELRHNLLSAGFGGAVYVVNRHVGNVQGVDACTSVAGLPEPVDLAVIAVPAAGVLDVARDCAAAGVHALVVISAGFAELGHDGVERQRELLLICRDAGMRLVGPNCLGVVNTAADVRLNATFAPHPAPPGAIGFLSQSGGIGLAISEAASRPGIGLSSFVSVGNKADLSGNDFLQYWEQDPRTKVALLYLESFGNPRKFARIARRLSAHKPVVVVKSGRTPAGSGGTASHTGAVLSASDVTVDALFEQAGVIRTDTLTEMFDVAALLSMQPVPAGDRTAIVTNAGGPGIVCAEACQATGAQVPEITGELARELAAGLPSAASVTNPIDMLATATADQYRTMLRALARSEQFDAVLAIFVPPSVTCAADVAAAIREVSAESPRCAIAAVFMTAEGPPPELVADGASVPGFQFPEDAARAVARAARHGQRIAQAAGVALQTPRPAVARGAAIISRELTQDGDWMSPPAVAALLDCHGISRAPQVLVTGDDGDVVDAAVKLGLPVAIKAVASERLHKTAAGVVAVGLDSPEAVRAAAARIRTAVTAAGSGLSALLVQPMISGPVELLVGVVQDPSFGPLLACGAGGTSAELLDVAVRITPVTDVDAQEMLAGLRTFKLLTGNHGAPACDLEAVRDVILRVSAMVEAHHEIVELDCNPVIAGPTGAVVVDTRIRLRPAPAPLPTPAVGR